MNYDPDRDLWLPSRRKFFFFGLAAGVAPFLPDVPDLGVQPFIYNPGFTVPSIQGWELTFWIGEERAPLFWIGEERVTPHPRA